MNKKDLNKDMMPPQKKWVIGEDMYGNHSMAYVGEGSLRYNQDKPEMFYWLLWPKSAEAVSRVMTQGAEKYEELNYAKATPETNPPKEYLSSATRHLVKASRYIISKDTAHLYDEESKCHHIAHAIWNLMMLLDYILPEVE